jgi:hypothetical protein
MPEEVAFCSFTTECKPHFNRLQFTTFDENGNARHMVGTFNDGALGKRQQVVK